MAPDGIAKKDAVGMQVITYSRLHRMKRTSYVAHVPVVL